MPEWHPVQAVMPVELYYPKPGTKEPFAVVRWVQVTTPEGAEVWRWRCVTFAEPRRLILDGYYAELEDAAVACHRVAISASVNRALDSQVR